MAKSAVVGGETVFLESLSGLRSENDLRKKWDISKWLSGRSLVTF
jgi:hypothetical protein